MCKGGWRWRRAALGLGWLGALMSWAGAVGGAPAVAQDGGPPSAAVHARLGLVREDLLRAQLDRLTGAADIVGADGGTTRIRSRSVRHPDIAVVERYLAGELSALGLLVQRLPFTFAAAAAPLHNLEATLLGSGAPAELYVLAAHYDSTARQTRGYVDATDAAPGADDNASGVALLLEAARVLADARPRATIRFLLFSAEEEGIFGSDDYAKAARARGDDVRFVLSMDPVGNTGPLGGNLYFTFDRASEEVAHFAESVRERHGIALPVLVVPGDSPLYPDDRSDHRSFWAVGYKGLHGGSLPGDTYHTVLDTADKVDVPFLADATRVVVAMLGEAAGPIAAPPAPPPATPKSSGCAVAPEAASSDGSRAGSASWGAAWLTVAVWFFWARSRRRQASRAR